MTVSAQTPIKRSTANGVTTVFPYDFKILAAADLEVSLDGVVKTLTTDYTLSGVGDDAGGNVTMLSAPANGAIVVRRRNMAYTREVDYQDQGELPTDTLDDDQDAPILMIQQLNEGLDRAIKVSITSDVDPDALIDELLAASEDATDAAGTATAAAAAAAASAAAITLPIPVASGGTGATTAAGARTALGAGAFGSTLFATTDQAAARTALGVTKIINVVEATPYTTYTGTAVAIPYDDTIPQITEGLELMTVTITPTNATSRLRIDFGGMFATSAANYMTVALFRDATANALDAYGTAPLDANTTTWAGLSFEVIAGSTSATTFRIRFGPNAGSAYVNGTLATRKYGGVSAATLRVTEIAP